MAKAAPTRATRTRNAKSKAARPKQPSSPPRLDLDKLDRDELVQLSKSIDEALRSYEKRQRDEALREMRLVAEKHGIALKDLVQGRHQAAVQLPKYRHPENPALTWSGRGRQPDWFKEAINTGHSRDDLLVA